MGRGNTCVIYDSDEDYAKRLMSVINEDNDIPYNAQVFTREKELDRYLSEKGADMLMICEEAYEYNSGRQGEKTVVLCEEEDEADEINSKNESELVGICKYQPSYQLLQSVMKYEKKGKRTQHRKHKVIGVYGFNCTERIVLSLAIARLLSEKQSTLFISLEEFACFTDILRGEEEENLSDALYMFRQNHGQFHKNIAQAVSHYERLDYIPEAGCADDLDEVTARELGTFFQSIGRELGYSYVVVDIGEGVHMPWNVLECCDEVYVAEGNDYFERRRLNNFERYLVEQGIPNVSAAMRKVSVNVQQSDIDENLWSGIPYTELYENLADNVKPGGA